MTNQLLIGSVKPACCSCPNPHEYRFAQKIAFVISLAFKTVSKDDTEILNHRARKFIRAKKLAGACQQQVRNALGALVSRRGNTIWGMDS
jgi:hypothetical protein